MNFGIAYAQSYDTLYADRDAAADVEFMVSQLDDNLPRGAVVCDLGCGTGIHARLFANKGFSVVAIDQSASMLALAQQRSIEPIAFRECNITDLSTLESEIAFDCAYSVFHVFSYLTQDAEVQAALNQISSRLRSGGKFLFDYWYGPAVVHSAPEHRTKVVEDEHSFIERTAEPRMVENNVVEVHYSMSIKSKATGKLTHSSEIHRMRYFFPSEIEQFAKNAGLQMVRTGEWLTTQSPKDTTWGVYTVVQKI